MLPANYQIECYDNAHALNHTAWSTLTKDDLFYQIDYLEEVEKTCKEFLKPHYGIAYDNGEAVGAFYFQLVQFKGEQLLSFFSKEHQKLWFKLCIQKPISFLLKKIDTPLLVLGNLLQTNHGGIFFSDDISSPKEKAAIVEALCRKTQLQCHASAILITNIYDSDEHFLKSLNPTFHMFHSEPDLQMNLAKEWKTFDDYVQTLQSKYRVRAKKILKESAGIETRLLSLTEIEYYQKQIFQLNRNVMKHVKFSLGDISESYFYDVAKYFGDKFNINAYFKDGELIGFSSMITEKRILNSHFIGMNYDFVNTHKLYNRILYDNLCFALERGLEVVKYGRTATEIKTTIGAKPFQMINYLKHRNPLINFFVPRALKLLKAPEFTSRNPFK
jgi:hypothetical protein